MIRISSNRKIFPLPTFIRSDLCNCNAPLNWMYVSQTWGKTCIDLSDTLGAPVSEHLDASGDCYRVNWQVLYITSAKISQASRNSHFVGSLKKTFKGVSILFVNYEE